VWIPEKKWSGLASRRREVGSGSGSGCVGAGTTVERRKGMLLAEYNNPKCVLVMGLTARRSPSGQIVSV
jgi:hypothetical protein